MRYTRGVAALAIAGLIVAACGGAETPTQAPTQAPTAPPASPTAAPDACAPEQLPLKTAGTLTIGADNPAYPPYFEIPDSPTAPWELGDPTTGEGFEGAVAYAVARELGFAKENVVWVVTPFDASFQPGPKNFDFYITQVSYKPERAEAVDMSDGYYFVNQAVVALADSPVAGATTITQLKDYRFGAQAATTSYDTIVNVIGPSQAPSAYSTNADAITALQNGQIDAIVVDLPTAFFITAVQLEGGKIVGQFEAPEEGEHFSLVLDKDSALTPCVNAAIGRLKASGELDRITQEWLADKADAPVFQP